MEKLSKEQLEAVLDYFYSSTSEMEKHLKEKGLIDEAFEVGEWYKSVEISTGRFILACYQGKDNHQYGFISGGSWSDKVGTAWLGGMETAKATPEEIQSALIKEAKKKGFKEGVKTKCLNVATDLETIGEFQTFTKDGRLLFDSDSEVGWCCIMDEKGIWADIIEEEKEEETKQSIHDKIEKLDSTHNAEITRKMNEIIDVINSNNLH
jgi:hypothetical protein